VEAGTGLSLIGDHAYQQIFSKLRGHPAAKHLTQEEYDFYGNYLSYIESRNFPSTLYVINLQHDSIALKSAEIRLQLGTDRIIEALVHELLDLHLPMLGFPLGELVKVQPLLNHYAQSFSGMCN